MSVPQLPHAGDEDFQQVVFSDPSPVLVEFFATWCGHCRRMAPIIEEVARDYAGRLRVVQVNAGEHTGTAQQLGVLGVPTFILFVNGKEVDRIVGEAPRESLDGHIGRALEEVAEG